MPWRARTDVGLSFVALVLGAAVVTSCVSVTTRAEALATPDGSARIGASPTPTTRPADGRTPEGDERRAPQPDDASTPESVPAATPEPIEEPHSATIALSTSTQWRTCAACR